MLIRIFVIADINNHRVRRPNKKELRAMFLFLKEKYLNDKLPAAPGKECHAIQVSEKTLDDRVRMLSSSSVLGRCSTCCWVRCTLSYGLPFILVVDMRVFSLITSPITSTTRRLLSSVPGCRSVTPIRSSSSPSLPSSTPALLAWPSTAMLVVTKYLCDVCTFM